VINFDVDETERLLVIRYSGQVWPDETERGLEQLRNGLANFNQGFDFS
jgi:hypothetical protein